MSMKTARKSVSDLSISTVSALNACGLKVGAAELVTRVIAIVDGISEEGASVKQVITAAKKLGWTRAQINAAIDCAGEDEYRCEIDAGWIQNLGG